MGAEIRARRPLKPRRSGPGKRRRPPAALVSGSIAGSRLRAMTAPTSAIATTAPIHTPYKLCPRMTPARTGVAMSVTATSDCVTLMRCCRGCGRCTESAAATVIAKNGEGEGGDVGCAFGQASSFSVLVAVIKNGGRRQPASIASCRALFGGVWPPFDELAFDHIENPVDDQDEDR